MPLFSPRKNKHSKAPSTSASASELASSQVAQQERQQSQPVSPWSAHAPSFGQSPSPLLRDYHALSTSATAAGEMFLFGGYVHSSNSPSNDLYVISTRDFSTTLLKTTGDVPSPRYGHSAVLSSTILLIWGGVKSFNDQIKQNQALDDSLYLLNLGTSHLLMSISREWTRIVVNGPGPGGRCFHTMTLVGSKLVVFGGRTAKGRLNDIWALDLDCLNSNPFWESYEPTPGNEKPLPRSAHVSVTTGDRIIIFGGYAGPHTRFNDTWSFNISIRKWTELQCTGSVPCPRGGHAAALVDDVMYVFGGRAIGGTNLGDLNALNLSAQRWTAFQDIGPSPCGRRAHAMASDGTRVFVLGGTLSPGAQTDEAKLIHVLDTKLLIYPKPDSNTVKHSEKTTQLAQKLSAGHLTQGQPQHRILSSSDAQAGAAHGAFPSQIATSEDMVRPASPQITRERSPDLHGPPSQPTGVDDKPRCVPQEDDDSESSTEHLGKLVAPDTSSEKEVARLEDERIADLERQLSETLAGRDRHIAQLTDRLAQKSALLDRAEANAAEVKKHAGLELRELQSKLDDLMLSRDEHLRTLEQAQSALQKATSRAADADEGSQPACEHEAELAEVRAQLEGKTSELEAVRLRLTDAEDGWAKSKAEARAQTAAGLVNTDVERVMHRLLERMRAMEAEVSSLRGNEKSIESMECRNEG
ncbi:hypothetical protein F5888DRAFT_1802298 [Russula emetica]|nr:hypothetical protein F5888DRAFT_1802298 [Russula emetica]